MTLDEYGELVLAIISEKYPEDANNPSTALVYTLNSMYVSGLKVEQAAASILRILDAAKGTRNN